jgi:hypothetical protein
MYIYIILCTVIIYFIFSYLDEQRNIKMKNHPTTMSMKVAYLFFAVIISIVIVFLFSNGIRQVGGGNDFDVTITENAHLRNIYQDVEVGLPKF